jgi:hypothetical protein
MMGKLLTFMHPFHLVLSQNIFEQRTKHKLSLMLLSGFVIVNNESYAFITENLISHSPGAAGRIEREKRKYNFLNEKPHTYVCVFDAIVAQLIAERGGAE